MKKVFCVVAILCFSVGLCEASLPVNKGTAPKFSEVKDSLDSDFFAEHMWAQVERPLYIDRLFTISLFKRDACNVNASGGVDDSWFFENRIGSKTMTPDEMAQGNLTSNGPSLEGKWLVLKAKSDGRSAGFFIQDSKGDRYLIKVDHQSYPEMNSSAEIICARFFHAVGYYVPEYSIVYFPFEQLELKEGLTYYDSTGFKQPVTLDAVRGFLKNAYLNKDKKYRASASKLAQGKVLGPMTLVGRRSNDPQDIVRHEDRRELRGLRVFSSWLNHFDMRRGNTFDAVIQTDEGWYIKHYLFDFGSCLGAFIGQGKTPEQGQEYIITPQEVVKSFLTLGFYKRPWSRVENIYPQTGYFTNKDFNAKTWRPQIPNYAFQSMTVADAQWACAIMKNITNDHIKAVVDAGQISNEKAKQDLINKLIERRDTIINYWMAQKK